MRFSEYAFPDIEVLLRVMLLTSLLLAEDESLLTIILQDGIILKSN